MLHRLRGFTLIELVIVIVLVGILGAVVGPLIGRGYSAIAQSQLRAQRVQQTEFALFHLRQDLQRSVPLSVNVRANQQTVEFLSLAPDESGLVARYRNVQRPPPLDALRLNEVTGPLAARFSFDVFANLQLGGTSRAVAVGGLSANELLADWNNRDSGNAGSVAAISGVVARSNPDCDSDCVQSPVTQVQLSAPTGSLEFRRHSPSYRAYFTTGPVAYDCDNQGRLLRVDGYDVANATPLVGNANRVLDEVINCRFSLQPGLAMQPPTLVVELSVGDTAESIRLVDTIVLGGAP